MPVFLYRWPNGDFSVVEAVGEDDAVEALDEFGNADGRQLVDLEDFRLAMNLKLEDDGTFALDGVGDHIYETFWRMYPKLEVAQEKGQVAVKKAVARERRRINEPSVPDADTELGKQIQRTLDLPVSLAKDIVNRSAKKALRRFKPKGKAQ